MQKNLKPYLKYFSSQTWMLKKALLLLLFFHSFHPTVTTAQDTFLSYGIETGPSISFSGINYHALAKVEWKSHELILGPKIVLSDTYLLARGPWGLNLGYRWNMVRQAKRMAFVAVEYQSAFLRAGLSNRKVTVHETHLTYGFQWQLGQRFRIGNGLGVGSFLEKSKHLITGQSNTLSGFSVLFRLFVNYSLSKK